MAKYRISAHGRLYFTEADNIAEALRHFAANVEGIATETIVEIGSLTNQQTGQTFGVTVHPPRPKAPRKPGRRATR